MPAPLHPTLHSITRLRPPDPRGTSVPSLAASLSFSSVISSIPCLPTLSGPRQEGESGLQPLQPSGLLKRPGPETACQGLRDCWAGFLNQSHCYLVVEPAFFPSEIWFEYKVQGLNIKHTASGGGGDSHL